MFRNWSLLAICIGWVFVAPLALCAEEKATPTVPADILGDVREHYSKLKDYHFEHQLVAVLEVPGKKDQELAKVDFELAVADAEGRDPADANATSFPTSMQRCRMSMRSANSSMVLTSDGRETVLYVPNFKQYKRGSNSIRAIGGPTSATMFLVANILPLALFTDTNFENARLVREERLTIADSVVDCHVIEATIRTPPFDDPANSDAPAADVPKPFLAGSRYLMFLAMHGLTNPDLPTMSLSTPGNKEQSIAITLWVDQREPKVWKSQLSEPLDRPADSADDTAPPKFSITDTFKVAKTKGPLSADLFRFEIPEGVKEVEKLGEK